MSPLLQSLPGRLPPVVSPPVEAAGVMGWPWRLDARASGSLAYIAEREGSRDAVPDFFADLLGVRQWRFEVSSAIPGYPNFILDETIDAGTLLQEVTDIRIVQNAPGWTEQVHALEFARWPDAEAPIFPEIIAGLSVVRPLADGFVAEVKIALDRPLLASVGVAEQALASQGGVGGFSGTAEGEDAWVLPVSGGGDDFGLFYARIAEDSPERRTAVACRFAEVLGEFIGVPSAGWICRVTVAERFG